MLTIHTLEVRFDVDSDDDADVLAAVRRAHHPLGPAAG